MNTKGNATIVRGALRACVTGVLAGTLALTLGACAGGGAGVKRGHADDNLLIAPQPDSITAGVWHLDESGGLVVPDAGPFRLHGSAGVDARTDFGRFRSARRFTRTVDSFLLVPYNPAMESTRGFTIEAWVQPTAYGSYELTPIAGRWTEAGNEHSWMFAIVGRKIAPAFASLPSPGWFTTWVTTVPTGRLVLIVQPDQAGAAQAFGGSAEIPLDTWTHVAASWDGEVVRLYVDGQLDTQYALRGWVRRTEAPLLVGNYFDTRRLTDYRGQLELDTTADRNPYYAFEGLIDELRLSTLARTSFESAP